MDKSEWEQLETDFLNLLLEVDPTIVTQLDFAQDFAKHLTYFAETWATNEENIDAHERWLSDWIKSNSTVSIISRFAGATGRTVGYPDDEDRLTNNNNDGMATAEMD